jgi:hypothetical protein
MKVMHTMRTSLRVLFCFQITCSWICYRMISTYRFRIQRCAHYPTPKLLSRNLQSQPNETTTITNHHTKSSAKHPPLNPSHPRRRLIHGISLDILSMSCIDSRLFLPYQLLLASARVLLITLLWRHSTKRTC